MSGHPTIRFSPRTIDQQTKGKTMPENDSVTDDNIIRDFRGQEWTFHQDHQAAVRGQGWKGLGQGRVQPSA
jgi:hypothetical protein